MVGGALLRIASEEADNWQFVSPTRSELPLTDRQRVRDYFRAERFDAVIHCAAKVGGIQANIADPVGFLVDNLAMNEAVIMGAAEAGISRLIFLGSSCMYPKDFRQPLLESDLLCGPLEPTNEGYALSKITGAKMCEYVARQSGVDYRTLIPCNLFGEEDHFGSAASHLVAAVITKIVDARESGQETVEIWGTGEARREFLFVDDLARYIVALLDDVKSVPSYLNLGYGKDFSITEYYHMVADIAGYKGSFSYNPAMPEGMARKLMDSSQAQALGWDPKVSMEKGLALAVRAYERSVDFTRVDGAVR